jgi:limonene-1,2-epoxide hydrolase
MPWFPDFVGAVELVRRQTRAEGEADPVRAYLDALNNGDSRVLQDSWPGEVVVYDPHAGEVHGRRHLRQFVHRNQVWLAERKARIEEVAATCVNGRAVVELLAHLTDGGRETAWPVAVVAESPDDRSVVFRTYCSQLPVDHRRHVRPPILPPADAQPGDVVGRYLAALRAGDTDAVVSTFASDGYVREPVEAHLHRGAHELRAYFDRCFSVGGIGLQPCAITDDGARCVLEYNCVSWGSGPVTPQAGLAVFERGADGLLVAARLYDDVEAPRTASAASR